jgi:hypothetical protein
LSLALSANARPRQDVEHIARLYRHVLAPVAGTALLVDGLDPFVQVAALDAVLFGVLSIGLQNEQVAGDEPDEGVSERMETSNDVYPALPAWS